MRWRVWVCAPADLPPAQGYRIGRVEAMTGHVIPAPLPPHAALASALCHRIVRGVIADPVVGYFSD